MLATGIIRHSVTRIAFAVLACLLPVAGVANGANETGRSEAGAGQGTPSWAQRSLSSSGRTHVASVVSTAVADVVLLSGGYTEGFREGMVCEIRRSNAVVAELIIVRCEAGRSAALITALMADTGIAPGDLATIKTVYSF